MRPWAAWAGRDSASHIDNPYFGDPCCGDVEKGFGIEGRAPSATVTPDARRILRKKRNYYLLYMGIVITVLVVWNCVTGELIVGRTIASPSPPAPSSSRPSSRPAEFEFPLLSESLLVTPSKRQEEVQPAAGNDRVSIREEGEEKDNPNLFEAENVGAANEQGLLVAQPQLLLDSQAIKEEEEEEAIETQEEEGEEQEEGDTEKEREGPIRKVAEPKVSPLPPPPTPRTPPNLEGLPPPIVSKMTLWLRADIGVDADDEGFVQSWSDIRNNIFEPPPPKTTTSARPRQSSENDASGNTMIDFPCALASKLPFKIPDSSTVFFVLKSRVASGRTFFALGPSAQFGISNDRKLSFQNTLASGKGAIVLAPSSGLSVEEGHTLVAGYRFSRGEPILASVNGKRWEALLNLQGEPLISKGFPAGESAVIGGGQSEMCDFVGSIGEVLVFNRPLDEVDTHAVLQHVMRKWKLGSPSEPNDLMPLPLPIAFDEASNDLRNEKVAQEAHNQRPALKMEKESGASPARAPAPPQPAIPAPPSTIKSSLPKPATQEGQIIRENGSCRIEGSRVMEWDAPANADVRSRHKWQDAQKESMDKIKAFSKGGKALKTMIHEEVVALDILRHDLFCK